MKTFVNICVWFLSCCISIAGSRGMAQSTVPSPIQGTYKSIYDMLKDVPGLEVKSESSGNGSVTVRGTGSLMKQGQPLFVVDGSIYDNKNVSSINPQDVSSINVLKDAASASAYGSQGMFGVILITTKKGTTGSAATVSSHTGSAYTYFIEHSTPLKIYGLDDKVIMEGIIQKQKGDSLVFIKKRKEVTLAVSSISRVEMVPQN